jgi:hypothetical protein
VVEVGRRRYRDWLHLKSDLVPDLFDDQPFSSGRYLFRGVGNADWTCLSAFDRRFAHLATGQRLEMWELLLQSFREACADHGVSSSIVDHDSRLLAFGQHFGLPTRLLDWSLSPYVATFFAFRNALSTSPPARNVAIWILDTTRSEVWSKEMGVELVSPPAMENLRLRNQAGRFTLARTGFPTLEEHVEHCASDGTPLIQAVVPAVEAARALPDLDSMGVNAAHLFPDVSGLAEAVTLRLEMNALQN